jgi:hypothetical protein
VLLTRQTKVYLLSALSDSLGLYTKLNSFGGG